MAKHHYTMRFYRSHDLDLISFAVTREFDVMHAVYSALTAFSNRERFVIELPPKRNADVAFPPNRIYRKTLTLDDEKDAKAVDVLSRIQDGYRNNFLKNLLRLYLCYPISEVFLKSSEDEEFLTDLFEPLRSGFRSVQAGVLHSSWASQKEKGPDQKKSREGKGEKKNSSNSQTVFPRGDAVPQTEFPSQGAQRPQTEPGSVSSPEGAEAVPEEEEDSLFDIMMGMEIL